MLSPVRVSIQHEWYALVSLCLRRASTPMDAVMPFAMLPRAVLLGSLALACGSAPSASGLFEARENARDMIQGPDLVPPPNRPGEGLGSGPSLPSQLDSGTEDGAGGSGTNAGPAHALDAGIPNAARSDAGTNDAVMQPPLRCTLTVDPSCDALVAALARRYSFDGTGTDVVDSVGTSNGNVVNGQLTGSGAVALSGSAAPEQYVNLPNGIVSSLSSATFEMWLTWGGGNPYQRIFDFGSSQNGEDQRGGGVDYLFLTPNTNDPIPGMVLAFRSTNPDSNGEQRISTGAPLATGIEKHVAVVVDGTSSTLELFVDGAAAGSIALPHPLSTLDDVNNWLGRSQFDLDAGFMGSFSELRIYDAALSNAQIALSFALGPDTPVSR